MVLKTVVHGSDEGGFWAEVPALPGCATQAETMPELMVRVTKAIRGWIDAEEDDLPTGEVSV